MRGLWHGYHAANVLLRLNADLLLFAAALVVALVAAAYLGTL
tara:strand:+ start:1683 stop:1808 length:126 start_codon:yes stop_codon:yes gene_type:complete